MAKSAGKTLTASSTTNVTFELYTNSYPESVLLPLMAYLTPPYILPLGVRGPATLTVMGFKHTVFLDCIWHVNGTNLVGFLSRTTPFRRFPILQQDCDFSVKFL